jgi:predicted enzyme related to lactoylglutathione lyase
MGERTSYTPGTFCWQDLSSPDQDRAKAFYTSLFGWEAFDSPMGDGTVYSMMSLGGRQVCGIAPQAKEQREAGVPPMWNSYISVESADDAVARARELGATPHTDAFDVFEAGRMAVLQDPQGAYVMVWEARQHPGAGLVNAHGAPTWNELASPDLDASATFYGELFGWTTEPVEGMPFPYHMIRTAAGNHNGGIGPIMAPGTPPHWLLYFGTNDLDASLAAAVDHGATTLAGPMDVGMGKIGVVQDPQGAVFALFEGNFDD